MFHQLTKKLNYSINLTLIEGLLTS